MSILQSVLPYLIMLILLAVLFVLLFGVISMLKGGEFNKRWGNKLMRARVILQAFAVFLIVLLGIFLSR